jgi:hypothetical protein
LDGNISDPAWTVCSLLLTAAGAVERKRYGARGMKPPAM